MFLDKDFLLTNDWAKKLFHGYAEDMPIIDYHCHLEPKEIYANKNYENLTRMWLNEDGVGDHYKWRLLRANGSKEELITGNGDDYEKFLAFVRAVEKAPGNPIFEWSHLELRRYFGINETITLKNAPIIWEKANELLAKPGFKPRRLIQKMNVKLVCTTDDPADDLAYHKLLAKEEAENEFKVLPTFRPDKLMAIDDAGFSDYIAKLAAVSGVAVHNVNDLKNALAQRIDYFHAVGGRLADHGMNKFTFVETSTHDANDIFEKVLNGGLPSEAEVVAYQSYIQILLMKCYVRHNWTMQMHVNVFRNDSPKNLASIGVNTGFDSVGDQTNLGRELVDMFATAEKNEGIPKTILYSLNPNDWITIASLMGSFQGDGVKQRIHLGCAWWFNDTKDGMRKQLTMYAQQSLLANFVGMLTDSRSFLSYPRHEYFRRVLCGVIGEWVEAGQLPEDEEYLGKIVSDISYNNAHEYFGFFD
jgi:glucuronate isomerase